MMHRKMPHAHVACLESEDRVFAGPDWARKWAIVIFPALVAGSHMIKKRVC